MDLSMFQNMFVVTVPILEKIIRPILVYIFLLVGLRLAGKRELAQLNPFDLVVLLTLSNTVQNAIIGEDNSVLGGVIGATTLLVVNYLMVRYVHKHKDLGKMFEGRPDQLMKNGHLNLKALDKENISEDELEIAARQQGFASLDEIDESVLEPGGAISFIAKRPEPDVLRQKELIKRLDRLQTQMVEIQAEIKRMQRAANGKENGKHNNAARGY
jgi:uncharacterized membrane protein YcaP (DUF421 family)